MPKKLTIEVFKHSNKDFRIIIKGDSNVIRASLNDSCLSKALIINVIHGSSIFIDTLIEDEK